MTVSLKHAFTSAIPDVGDATLVEPSDWNAEHTLSMATGKMLGRTTAGVGAFEEITIGSGLSLSAGSLSATASGGTVTSVAALTLGTTGTDLSSTVATGTTTPVITLQVPTASATNRGALSSTDWSTFNGKQATITFGTGVQTALGVNVGSAGAPVLFNGAGGTPSSLTLTNATGLPAAGGGTGQSVYAVGDILYASTTTALSKLADVATGNALISGGVGVAPSWGKINVTTAISGILPSANGGTGMAFFTVSGPATTAKTFTFPNASATVLTDNAAVTVAQGGTGRATGTTAYALVATGTTATGAQQTLANGATTEVLVGGGAAALPVWTTASGSGAPLRQTSPTLVTPVLGTPTSGTLTNCTGPWLLTAGGTLSGAANWNTTATVASATTCDIGAAASNYVSVTGTTTITGLGTIAAGAMRWVNFTGILTLTHNAASLILPTSANITTAAGDNAVFVSLASGNWRCISYQRADGTALVGAGPTTGTWTPALAFGGSSTGFVYSVQSGSYTKFSNGMVTVSGTIVATTKGSGTGNVTITGFPFTMAADAAMASYPNNVSYTGTFYVSPQGGQTFAYLIALVGASQTILTDTSYASGSYTVLFSGSYNS